MLQKQCRISSIHGRMGFGSHAGLTSQQSFQFFPSAEVLFKYIPKPRLKP